MATALTAIRAPEDVMERYTHLAQGTGRSRSFYINEALEESIDRLEYEYGILHKVEDWRAGRLETVCLDELEDSLGLAD